MIHVVHGNLFQLMRIMLEATLYMELLIQIQVWNIFHRTKEYGHIIEKYLKNYLKMDALNLV